MIIDINAIKNAIETRKTRSAWDKGGEWRPSRYEEWLDVQARALYQAFRLICRAAEGRTL